MNRNEIKLNKLVFALKRLGFQMQKRGSHGLFYHPETGLLVSLPMNRKEVPAVYLRAVISQIINRGIVTEDELWHLLK